jgi:hypothetical protein
MSSQYVPPHSRKWSEPHEDFNYDEIDARLNPQAVEEETRFTMAAETFAEMLRWCWADGAGSAHALDAAFRKFVGASLTLNPKLSDGPTMARVAELIGVTKQSLCKHSLNFRGAFKADLIRYRSDESREKMRAARLAQRDANGKVLGRNFGKHEATAA